MQTHLDSKFTNGELARNTWAKKYDITDVISVQEFNEACGGVFRKCGNIVLDNVLNKKGKPKRQTTIMVEPCEHMESSFGKKNEQIYLIVKDNKVMKIGGTRTSMKERFGSYLCGFHVIERGKSGKMSVTNAHIYHSIEKDLLETNSTWCFWVWDLPRTEIRVPIFDETVTVVAQTYHAYESCCIKKFKNLTGSIPILCDNCDPNY
tara:strand:+ start:673 stop:1290 length:618 start_codon:yes stop_codon:yes gene_type:complete